jgi:hypothetical protein
MEASELEEMVCWRDSPFNYGARHRVGACRHATADTTASADSLAGAGTGAMRFGSPHIGHHLHLLRLHHTTCVPLHRHHLRHTTHGLRHRTRSLCMPSWGTGSPSRQSGLQLHWHRPWSHGRIHGQCQSSSTLPGMTTTTNRPWPVSRVVSFIYFYVIFNFFF